MRSLRWVGLVFSLLIVGVLGGLMAPLPSEALPPTLTIDLAPATLVLADPSNANRVTLWPACWKLVSGLIQRVDPGFSSCYVVSGTSFGTTKTFGAWTVGSASATNQFRVLVNDTNTIGATDDMKATGGTFKPTSPATGATKTTHVILQNTFSNPAGDWKWAMGAGLTITPPSTETVVGDTFKLSATGFFPPTATTGTSLGGDIAIVVYPKTNGQAGTISKRNPTFTKAGCNTGGSKCDVKVKYDYLITIVGFDVARTDDSVSGCGGTCDPGDGTNKLAPCAQLVQICEDKMAANEAKDIAEGKATGAVVAEACTGTCIVIILDATPDNEATGKQFVLEATLQGDPQSPITLTADSFGTAGKAFSPLVPDLDPVVDEWTFDVTSFDTSKTGTWQADQWSCVSKLLDGTLTFTVDTQPNGGKGPLHVLTLNADDIATCTVHIHRDPTKK